MVSTVSLFGANEHDQKCGALPVRHEECLFCLCPVGPVQLVASGMKNVLVGKEIGKEKTYQAGRSGGVLSYLSRRKPRKWLA